MTTKTLNWSRKEPLLFLPQFCLSGGHPIFFLAMWSFCVSMQKTRVILDSSFTLHTVHSIYRPVYQLCFQTGAWCNQFLSTFSAHHFVCTQHHLLLVSQQQPAVPPSSLASFWLAFLTAVKAMEFNSDQSLLCYSLHLLLVARVGTLNAPRLQCQASGATCCHHWLCQVIVLFLLSPSGGLHGLLPKNPQGLLFHFTQICTHAHTHRGTQAHMHTHTS